MNDLVKYTNKSITLAPELTQKEWEDIHANILLARHASRAWVKQSRLYAEQRWGAEYVALCEIQMELSLDLPKPLEKLQLNPNDKSKGIITIEGICQYWAIWERNMDKEMTTWDKSCIHKALTLLEPIEKRVQLLRSML